MRTSLFLVGWPRFRNSEHILESGIDSEWVFLCVSPHACLLFLNHQLFSILCFIHHTGNLSFLIGLAGGLPIYSSVRETYFHLIALLFFCVFHLSSLLFPSLVLDLLFLVSCGSHLNDWFEIFLETFSATNFLRRDFSYVPQILLCFFSLKFSVIYFPSDLLFDIWVIVCGLLSTYWGTSLLCLLLASLDSILVCDHTCTWSFLFSLFLKDIELLCIELWVDRFFLSALRKCYFFLVSVAPGEKYAVIQIIPRGKALFLSRNTIAVFKTFCF